jgi:hypothetical protein
MILQGGCYCGAVRYEALGPPMHCTLCHCEDCRRVSGAPALAWFSVPFDRLRFTKGAPTELRSSAAVTRSFCGRCGTQLTWRGDASADEIDVTTCSLDNPQLAAPQDHTFAASRVRWLEVCDRLPAFPRTRSEGHG